MKKLLSFLFLALCFVACQNEPNVNVTNDDLAVVTLNVGVPELATRGDVDAKEHNSGVGAIDFLNDNDWGLVDLRYIIEIYPADNYDAPIFKETKTVNKYEPVSFELRLVPNRNYRFVVWADFVNEGQNNDWRYNTSKGLANITPIGDFKPMDETRDAYFYSETHEVSNTAFTGTLVLKRPFAKVRVVTTDLNYLTNYATPTKAVVKYYHHEIFNDFNAVTRQLSTVRAEDPVEYNIVDNYYSNGYDADADKMTIFADYILAEEEWTEINFTLATYHGDDLIFENDFNTQIPVKRNHLTTIMGNVLTTGANITVEVDNKFDGEYIRNWDDKVVALTTPTIKAAVEGNVVTLNWEAIEGAANYSVTCGTEMPVFIDGTEYVFTGEYETEYTFTVVAIPADEEANLPSEAAYVTVTTEAKPVVALATPVIKAAVDGNEVTLNWEAIEGAAQYSVTCGTEMPVFVEGTEYVFKGEYETEYTFAVVAIPADEEANLPSEAAYVTVSTEAEPVVGPVYTTVAEFLAAPVNANVEYTLKGTITSVANTTYGNFDLTDDTGTVYIYGLMSPDGATNKYWATSGAKLGDDIVIKTVRAEYNGSAQGSNAKFVELLPGSRAFYTVDPAAVDFPSTGGEMDVEVFAYNTTAGVTATSDNEAFAVEVNGYVITVTAAANELEEAVTGNITINVGDLEATVVKATLAAKPASGQVEGGSDDFHTISATNTSYVTGKTTAGWNYKNCAIFKGGTSDSSPAFKMIGDASNRALCMNGKTSGVGSITSPTLTTGCGTLKFNYGLPFSDTKIKFRVDIMQNGVAVKTFTVDKSSATKLTKYSHEENINVAGDFQIVFTNLSPSNSTSNKDRTAIWDVEWNGYNN